jgi:transcriptional regulator with XRE-family HTH domain
MVSGDPEKLGDFVKRIRKAKRLSYKEVAERSRGRISAAYVGKIETDSSVQPSVPKLQGLAFGLGEPEEAVINIVRGEKPAPTEFDERLAIAASGYENWTDEERDRFIQVVSSVAAGIRATRQGA